MQGGGGLGLALEAGEDDRIGRADETYRADVDDVVTLRREQVNKARRQIFVEEEPQAP